MVYETSDTVHSVPVPSERKLFTFYMAWFCRIFPRKSWGI